MSNEDIKSFVGKARKFIESSKVLLEIKGQDLVESIAEYLEKTKNL